MQPKMCLSVICSDEDLSPRRASYAPGVTPQSPMSSLQRANSAPRLSIPESMPRSRPDSSLFRMIVQRGQRRDDTYPVIGGLYSMGTGDISPLHASSPIARKFPVLPRGLSRLAVETCQPAASPTSKGQSLNSTEGEGKCCITVAVRVRPLAQAEVAGTENPVLAVENNRIILRDPNKKSKSNPPHQFNFDEVLWSANTPGAGSLPVASQQDVYEAVGHPLLQNLIRGYNACLLCYGQTGSGKTYTMTGTPTEPGIVPRYAEAVFQFLQDQQHVNEISAYRVQVSYMEIYNEKVHDLLAGKTPQHKNLRVRQHPVRGSFVEGLSQHNVQSSATILKLVRQGNEQRATAATRMNDRSSRSHAIVTIEVSQQAVISQTGTEDLFSSKTSRVYLVDLAGSERMAKSDVDLGARFQEMTSINQSLSTLSRVIEALSDPSGTAKRAPYRESLLTWLLMDSFGGNSKTTMIATVSPALSNAAETLSTLRYASRARKIVNKAVINEDPSMALIGALQTETQQLRAQLAEMTEKSFLNSRLNAEEVEQLRTKLQFSETLIGELKEDEENARLEWEKRLASLKRESKEVHQQEVQRCSEATEKQLDKALMEVRHQAQEVTMLRQMLVGKQEELAACAGRQQELQEEICTKEAVICQREIQLLTIRVERERLAARNAEMLMQMRREVAQREQEAQLRRHWEQLAKAMEQRLEEEVAQRLAAEQMLVEVLRGEREAIRAAAVSHQQLMVAMGCLQGQQYPTRAASELQQDADRMEWAAELESLGMWAPPRVTEMMEAKRRSSQPQDTVVAECSADMFGAPLKLHEVLDMLEAQEKHISCPQQDMAENGPLMNREHFAQDLMEKFSQSLQLSAENRREKRDPYDDLESTTEVKQDVDVQLRINQQLAQERNLLQREREGLKAELQDVCGRFQRAMEIIRRVHSENECLRMTVKAEGKTA